jgi:hypothetical protein
MHTLCDALQGATSIHTMEALTLLHCASAAARCQCACGAASDPLESPDSVRYTKKHVVHLCCTSTSTPGTRSTHHDCMSHQNLRIHSECHANAGKTVFSPKKSHRNTQRVSTVRPRASQSTHSRPSASDPPTYGTHHIAQSQCMGMSRSHCRMQLGAQAPLHSSSLWAGLADLPNPCSRQDCDHRLA